MKRFNVVVLFFVFGVIYAKVSSDSIRFGRRVGGNLKAPTGLVDLRAVSTKWFTQKLDHFDDTNTEEWQQRYFVNDQHFNTSARNVAYLFVGGESEANPVWMNYGSWIESAPSTGALLFQLEHRYYGDSQPKEDLSTENLKYLSSRQAIADAALFIEGMNKLYELAPDVKWIAFGGSYAGNLVAWLREKYPNHVHAAISSSAPILAELDFQNYMDVVANGLRIKSQQCVDAVRESVVQLEDVVNNRTTMEPDTINLCEPLEENLDNEENLSELFQNLAYVFASIAQYDGISPGQSLSYACILMTDEGLGTPLERFGRLWQMQIGGCLSYDHEEAMESLKNIDAKSGDGMRQWIYQTCTEFGYYQTSTKEPQTFGHRFPIEVFLKMCTESFGPEFDKEFISKAIDDTNEYYGGLNINVTNVLFIHGSIDPWHALGLLESNNPKVPVIYINGTSHCADMYPSNPTSDSEELLAAKTAASKYVLTWLNE